MELISFFLLADKSIKQPLFCKDNFFRKWQFRFGIAKAALLRCKTYAFTVQNSHFWNAKQ